MPLTDEGFSGEVVLVLNMMHHCCREWSPTVPPVWRQSSVPLSQPTQGKQGLLLQRRAVRVNRSHIWFLGLFPQCFFKARGGLSLSWPVLVFFQQHISLDETGCSCKKSNEGDEKQGSGAPAAEMKGWAVATTVGLRPCPGALCPALPLGFSLLPRSGWGSAEQAGDQEGRLGWQETT